MSAETATEQEIAAEQQAKEQPKRRIGRFQVSHAPIFHDWRCLLPLFAKVVVLRAESIIHADAIDYIALCDEFDEVDIGDAPPAYQVHYSATEGGADNFNFVRVQQ
jgi:hypothetical protein